MEPFSTAVGALAVLETTKKVVKKVYGLSKANETIQQLENELSGLQILIADVHDSLQPPFNGTLELSIKKAKSVAEALTAYIEYELKKTTNTGSTANKSRLLSSEHRIARFHNDMRSVKNDITTGLALSFAGARLNTGHISQLDLVELTMHSQTMDSRILAMADTMDRASENLLRVRNLLEPVPASYTLKDADLGKNGAGADQEPGPSDTTASDESKRKMAPAPQPFVAHNSDDSSHTSASPRYNNMVELKFRRRTIYGTPCRCAGRAVSRWQSPTFAQRVVGALMVGYNRVSMPGRKCDCVASRTSTWTVSYRFPLWLAERMIDLQAKFSTAGPELLLGVYNVRPKGSPMFSAIMQGNLKWCQELLASGQATGGDVDESGDTLLWWAMVIAPFYEPELIMLLSAITPQRALTKVNELGSSVALWALEYSIAVDGTFESVVSHGAKMDFGEYGLTELQCTVVGFESMYKSFGAAIDATPRDEIDSVDTQGKTALMWACIACKPEQVFALLQKGADPSTRDRRGLTALHHWAESSGDRLTLDRLLGAGADVNARSLEYQRTLMHYLVLDYKFRPNVGKRLQEMHFSFEARDKFGATLLHFAAQYGNLLALRWLVTNVHGVLEHDVVHSRNEYQQTPLMLALRTRWGNKLAIVQELLKFDVDTSAIDYDGRGYLSYVACFADRSLITVLEQEHLDIFNREERNVDGWSAYDFAQARSEGIHSKWWDPIPPEKRDEWMEAFMWLWLKVSVTAWSLSSTFHWDSDRATIGSSSELDDARSVIELNSSEESDEEWADSLEQQHQQQQ